MKSSYKVQKGNSRCNFGFPFKVYIVMNILNYSLQLSHSTVAEKPASRQCGRKGQGWVWAHTQWVGSHVWQHACVGKPSQSRVRKKSTQGKGRDHDGRLVTCREIDHINLLKKMRTRFLTVEEETINLRKEKAENNIVVLDWNCRYWCELMNFKKYN